MRKYKTHFKLALSERSNIHDHQFLTPCGRIRPDRHADSNPKKVTCKVCQISLKSRKKIIKPKRPTPIRIQGRGDVTFSTETLKQLPEHIQIHIFVSDNSCGNSEGHTEIYSNTGMVRKFL